LSKGWSLGDAAVLCGVAESDIAAIEAADLKCSAPVEKIFSTIKLRRGPKPGKA
jgi:hypothetical protein